MDFDSEYSGADSPRPTKPCPLRRRLREDGHYVDLPLQLCFERRTGFGTTDNVRASVILPSHQSASTALAYIALFFSDESRSFLKR